MAECAHPFQVVQQAFAAHIRDPEKNPAPPGIPAERIAIYRELFFNNIESFLATGFPVLKNILGSARWSPLVRQFYAGHCCRTPLFSEIAREFVDYLGSDRRDRSDEPPFLIELAHYEWVELALAIAEPEPPLSHASFADDPLAHRIRLSAVAWPLAYHYPVHLLCADFQPQQASGLPTCLVVYRDREDNVRFMEVNQVSFRLLDLLNQEGALNAEDCLLRLAAEIQYPDPWALLGFGKTLLCQFEQRGIIGVALSA
jgi:hypothetical protein